MKQLPITVVACAALSLGACAASLSPQSVRDEIVRQTGRPPASELELKLGRLLMATTRAAVPAKESLPLQGLRRLEIAFYGLEPATELTRLDFSSMRPRGWDSAVRWAGPESTALVLVRPKQESRPIGDLVLVASGERKVLYARLGGRMARTLPEKLRGAIERGGPDAVHHELMELTDDDDGELEEIELP
ncbi:MAG: hypothetical protein ACRD2Z_15660 [Thermoanaerobaculia bacterium]